MTHRSSWKKVPWLEGYSCEPLSSNIYADACVIGLGGSGLAAIETLLENGLSVIGIDKGLVADGAAGSNGGFLLAGLSKFYHESVWDLGRDISYKIYNLTMTEIDRLENHNSRSEPQKTSDIKRTGSLRIASSKEELLDCQIQYDVMSEDCLPVELYKGEEGEGLLFPSDASCDPLALCLETAVRLKQRFGDKIQLFQYTEAVDIQSGCVSTRDRDIPLAQLNTISCKHVIVAADGHLELLFPELAPEYKTYRLQMLATLPTKEITVSRPVYYRYGYEFWCQDQEGRVFLGGFRDQFMANECTHSEEPSREVQDKLEEFLRGHLKVTTPIENRWAASVGFTNNGLPIIREMKPGVWAVGGYNGTGNLVGRLCGREAALTVLGKPSVLMSILGVI